MWLDSREFARDRQQSAVTFCNMENPTKIGFIGAGNMAQAVVKGLRSSGIYIKDTSCFLSTPSHPGKDFKLAASATKDTSISYQKMKVGKSWVLRT